MLDGVGGEFGDDLAGALGGVLGEPPVGELTVRQQPGPAYPETGRREELVEHAYGDGELGGHGVHGVHGGGRGGAFTREEPRTVGQRTDTRGGRYAAVRGNSG